VKYLYMNHRIKQVRPTQPVIVALADNAEPVEADCFAIKVAGVVIGHVVYDRDMLDAPGCKHDVKAWVELNENVEVVAIDGQGRHLAEEKKPNRAVRVQH
jgi:hypothetical protein